MRRVLRVASAARELELEYDERELILPLYRYYLPQLSAAIKGR